MHAIDKLAQKINNDTSPLLPDSMIEIIDVIEQELFRNKIDSPRLLACKIALAQGWAMGGRAHYIPTLKRVEKIIIKDNVVIEHCKGASFLDLSRKYKISTVEIRNILKTHRI